MGQRTGRQTDCGVRTKGWPEHRLIGRQTGLHLQGNDLQVSTAYGLRDTESGARTRLNGINSDAEGDRVIRTRTLGLVGYEAKITGL